MPTTAGVAAGGMVYHVLNRGVGRMQLFDADADYAAFERIVEETLETRPMRICGWCLMPNHWHFVLWPSQDGELSGFMQRLTNTHVHRWERFKGRVGYGHVYQARFKSFPVQTDEYFYQVMRYVERNALRANLVDRAEDWQWSSLWRRCHGTTQQKLPLSEWPLARPRNWRKLVNQPQSESELEAIRRATNRGRPYGDEKWVIRTARRLGLESTLRNRGRPKKAK